MLSRSKVRAPTLPPFAIDGFTCFPLMLLVKICDFQVPVKTDNFLKNCNCVTENSNFKVIVHDILSIFGF